MPSDRNSLTLEELRLPMFDYAEEPVQHNRILGSGDEGVVVSATIKGKEYALKVVSITLSSLLSKLSTNVIYCSLSPTSPVALDVLLLLMNVVPLHGFTTGTLMVSTHANATAG